MPRFQVTFKGPDYDITVTGDSAEKVVEEYIAQRKELKQALESGQARTELVSKAPSGRRKVDSNVQPIRLTQLSVPTTLAERFVDERKELTNWHTLYFLLHHAPQGLTNKQIRTLSEELGKPITFSWFDTEFHRKRQEGFVISRRPSGSSETLYFLAEPGKKEALRLIKRLSEKPLDTSR